MDTQTYEDQEDPDELPAISINPFGSPQDRGAAVAVEKQRANAETQAAIIVAQQFPRSEVVAMDRILQAFTRPTLAEKAQYQYARGGTDIVGPSIRAAEAIAQNWGNMQFGIRELEQRPPEGKRPGESTVESWAWDVQLNNRTSRLFQIKHWRETKRGGYALEDPRDIYELVANNGARRERACILALIPGDVVEAAMKQAEATLRTKVEITPERLQNVVLKFSDHGITKAQIELRIQRRLESITPALMVNLGRILNSLNDGMSVPADWFELPNVQTQPTTTRGEQVKDLLAKDGPIAKPVPNCSKMTPEELQEAIEREALDCQMPTEVFEQIVQRETKGKLTKANVLAVIAAIRAWTPSQETLLPE